MRKTGSFRLIMISAMYENGGNTLHRFLDGHPQLFVYPFESQPGTFLVADYLTSLFPLKYRWPELSLSGNFSEDYELIIDEEMKARSKTPFVSKFKKVDIQINDKERKKIFLQQVKNKERNRRNIISAFFISTFLAWKNYRKTGKEIAYVGYSPIIGVDAEKIFIDFPNANIIHIVRNPYSSFAETKRRPVPYSIKRYAQTWNISQLYALNFSNKFPRQFHLVKFEDLINNPKKFFMNLTKKIGISYSKNLEYPSWNGAKLDSVYPWGTIRLPTPAANTNTLNELSKEEYKEIKSQTTTINKLLGYDHL